MVFSADVCIESGGELVVVSVETFPSVDSAVCLNLCLEIESKF